MIGLVEGLPRLPDAETPQHGTVHVLSVVEEFTQSESRFELLTLVSSGNRQDYIAPDLAHLVVKVEEAL